jgi:hypothetical protein
MCLTQTSEVSETSDDSKVTGFINYLVSKIVVQTSEVLNLSVNQQTQTKVRTPADSKLMPFKRLILSLLWLFFLLACTSLDRLSSQPLPATATPLNPTPASVPVLLSPASTVALPTATPEATATPTQVAISPASPTPTIAIDLAPYRQAMLPNFTGDVDTVAASGASFYELDVTLAPDGQGLGLQLTGTEKVHYTNTESIPLSDIYFRLYPNLPGYGGQMQVKTIMVDRRLVNPTLEADNSALRVPLPAPLQPGSATEISLTYEAIVPAGAQHGYNIFSYSNGTAALAGFFPIIAVYDETGWEINVPPPYGDATYLDVAFFQLSLTVPENMVVAASGSLLETRPNGDQTKTLVLVSGPMRDFYVAMRADYQVVSQRVDGVLVNSYYPPHLKEGGELVLRYAADALKVFNKRFGTYPYAEFDIVATPTLAGGVEYPGLVVVTEHLYDQTGGFFEHAAVHEVAHQWWYGLVGNDQVKEPWLDESLTNYSTVIYWEEIKGAEMASDIIAGFFLGPYRRARDEGRDRPVIGPVSAFSEGEYSTFVYSKGPLFFNALRQEVGDETYFRIMQTYYSDNKYKVVSADTLFDTIEQLSHQNIEPLRETWLQNP